MGCPHGFVLGKAATGELFRHHPAIAQQDEPVCQGRLTAVVGYQEKGLAVLVHQAAQQG